VQDQNKEKPPPTWAEIQKQVEEDPTWLDVIGMVIVAVVFLSGLVGFIAWIRSLIV
jgi:hypothetical protein